MRAAMTLALALATATALSLRPVTSLFRWLLEPDISPLFNPVVQEL
jgi:hypothetical protein